MNSFRVFLVMICCCLSLSVERLMAAVTIHDGDKSLVSQSGGEVVLSAHDLYRSGQHQSAVAIAKQEAEKGSADAYYILGLASETGNGAPLNLKEAMAWYTKGMQREHVESTLRLSALLLNSNDKKEREKARLNLETLEAKAPCPVGRMLGEAYVKGVLTKQPDVDLAVYWWNRSAQAGDGDAAWWLAQFYSGVLGVPKARDEVKADRFYEKAALKGHAQAMIFLGDRLLSGDSLAQQKGKDWLEKAIAQKVYDAYLILGRYEEKNNDLTKAFRHYQRGADMGHADCMVKCAECYLDGKGCSADPIQGIKWLEKAVALECPSAYFKLATHEFAQKTANLEKGYRLLLGAANLNHIDAQNEMGIFYMSGKFGIADFCAGVAWLQRAATNGSAHAQANLAAICEVGMGGVPVQMEQAVYWYQLAAKQGDARSMLALARLIDGNQVPKESMSSAWAYATLAAELGQQEGSGLAAKISSKLSSQQKEKAQLEYRNMKK